MGFFTFKFGLNFIQWTNPLDFIITVFCWPFADDALKEQRRREAARMAHELRMAQMGYECTTCQDRSCPECTERSSDVPKTIEQMRKLIEALKKSDHYKRNVKLNRDK